MRTHLGFVKGICLDINASQVEVRHVPLAQLRDISRLMAKVSKLVNGRGAGGDTLESSLPRLGIVRN